MSRQLQLVDGRRRRAAASRSEAFRLRPGERPVWLELELDDAEARAWRCRASEFGLSVDVWLALQAEWAIISADLAEGDAIHLLVEQARLLVQAPTLAPTGELRAWVRYLAAGPAGDVEHDLPSVALPARIVARLRPATLADDLRGYATRGREQDALVAEGAASLMGMTMEAWVYREAARLAS